MLARVRPWRLAREPSGRKTGVPVTASRTSTQSPAAQTWGTLVARRSSTAMAPVGPMRAPMLRASSTSGSTPTATTARSAVTLPVSRRRVTPSSPASSLRTGESKRTSTPLASRWLATQAPTSRSRTSGRGVGPASTRKTFASQRAPKASASSQPTRPAPTRATRPIWPRRRPSSNGPRSSQRWKARTRGWSGCPGSRRGRAPVARTSSSQRSCRSPSGLLTFSRPSARRTSVARQPASTVTPFSSAKKRASRTASYRVCRRASGSATSPDRA